MRGIQANSRLHALQGTAQSLQMATSVTFCHCAHACRNTNKCAAHTPTDYETKVAAANPEALICLMALWQVPGWNANRYMWAGMYGRHAYACLAAVMVVQNAARCLPLSHRLPLCAPAKLGMTALFIGHPCAGHVQHSVAAAAKQ
jgi:hypothetical protein